MDSKPPFKTHNLLNTLSLSHGFFGRRGGISKTTQDGNYAGLNAGHGSGDVTKDVSENRNRVAHALGAKPQNLLSLHQYHSTDVVTLTKKNGNPVRPKADGHVTQIRGLALSALGADCGPVLFCDPNSQIIGACHAGWRGAVSGITDNTILAMEAIGAKRENIRAVLGPCISQKNYEVGSDFQEDFVKRDPDYAVFFKTLTGHSGKPKAHFDLKAFIISRLKQAGLTQISALSDCTYEEPEHYFSYRYNTHYGLGDYGRNISAIILTE